MSNLAHQLGQKLTVAHKAPNHSLIKLLSLFCSVNFDKTRIVIAEHELSENFLTLYLEDKEDFKADLADTVMYKLPISTFATIISNNELNSYPETLFTERGNAYEGRIEIASPTEWYENDASTYEKKYTLDMVKTHLLKSLLTA
jgi:hypothetical protein